jgi:hypothetical protein
MSFETHAWNQEARKRWFELHDLRHAAAGYTTRARINVFRLSALTYRANYQDLMDTLASICSESIPDGLTMFEFGDHVDPKLEVLCRKFFNYLSSYAAFRDHMRVLYGELYEPTQQIPDYQAQVEARFKHNGLALLFQELRNVNLHARAPILIFTHTENMGCFGDTTTTRLSLKKEEILSFDGLNKVARRYVQDLPDKLDITPLISEHFGMINEFYEWFSAKQAEIHKEPFAELERIESEMRKLAEAARDYARQVGLG